MNWKQLWAKIWTPANKAKAIDAGIKAAQKLKEKQLSKDQYKAGCFDPITLGLAFLIGATIMGVCSSGVNTRSIVHRSQITIKDSPGAVVFVDFGTNSVDVSGSGGVSIPVSGGGK